MTVVDIRQRIAVPLYALSDAARYAHVPRKTLQNWAEGYESTAGTWYPPLLVLPDEQPFDQTALSFENLIEAALIGQWRKRRVPLQRIRKAHFLALEEFGDHPFARQRIYVGGTDLFVEADRTTEDEGGSSFTVLTRANQYTLAPLIADSLEYIDWQTGEGFPYQYRPAEGRNIVKLNPNIEFGLPNIHRIRTEIILQRFLAQESVDEIAGDFDLSEEEVEQALRYEWALPKAA